MVTKIFLKILKKAKIPPFHIYTKYYWNLSISTQSITGRPSQSNYSGERRKIFFVEITIRRGLSRKQKNKGDESVFDKIYICLEM
jgi:hypothetical protein